MDAIDMTQAALLDALREAMEKGVTDEGHALTTQELMDALGLSQGRTRGLLRELIRSGQCEPVHVRRADMTGRPVRVPAYRMKSTAG